MQKRRVTECSERLVFLRVIKTNTPTSVNRQRKFGFPGRNWRRNFSTFDFRAAPSDVCRIACDRFKVDDV